MVRPSPPHVKSCFFQGCMSRSHIPVFVTPFQCQRCSTTTAATVPVRAMLSNFDADSGLRLDWLSCSMVGGEGEREEGEGRWC